MNDEHLRQRYPELAELVDGPEFTAIAIAFQAKDREITRLREERDAARTTRDETHLWTNTDWKERAEQAGAAVARVRRKHAEVPHRPGYCYCGNASPCPTIRALDEEEADCG